MPKGREIEPLSAWRIEERRIMENHIEQILYEIIDESQSKDMVDLKSIMKQLRKRCAGFSETEAILHMMDALIIEAKERRGW